MYLEYPHIHGTTDEKLEQISGYLYKLAEISNYNLEQSTPEGIFRQAAEAVASAESEAVEKDKRAQFRGLRDLIIKSAGSVMISEQEISHSLAGLFVAASDFGTFKKETEQTFTANSESFKSLFKKDEEISTDITNYKSEMQNYIFAGYDGDVFALDIGLLKNKYTEGEKEVINDTPKKFRITPTRASLFSGSNEVAYLSENAVYFPNAHITGGTLDIGGGTFKVSDKGELTASSGIIAGWKIGTGADGLPTGSNAIYNTVEGTDGNFSVGMQASGSTVNVNFFVKKYNTLKNEWEDVFYVKNNGRLKAIDAEIEGTITSSTIKSSTIEVGTYGKGSSGFKVDSKGNLYASNATIYGTLKATSIDNGTYGEKSTGFKLLTDGTLQASNATIRGKIYATDGEFSGTITATGGSVGGFGVNTRSIYNKNSNGEYLFYLSPNDSQVNCCMGNFKTRFYMQYGSSKTSYVLGYQNTLYIHGDKLIVSAPVDFTGSSVTGVKFIGDVYTSEDGTSLQTQINGKASSTHNHDSSYAAKSHTHSNYVPTSRTVNGKALSGNISLGLTDVWSNNVQTGEFEITYNGSADYGTNLSGNGYATVDFPTAFGDKPVVLLTIVGVGNPSGYDVIISQRSKSGFVAKLKHISTSTLKVTVNYIAIGTKG